MPKGNDKKLREQPTAPANAEVPSIAEPFKWFAYHIRRDWPKMTETPIGLLSVMALALFFSWLFVWQVVVPAKNEQINTKQGQIELIQKELEIEKSSHIVSVTNVSVMTITNYAATVETNHFNVVTTNYLIANVTNYIVVAVTNYITATNVNRKTSAVGNLPLHLQILGCYSGIILKDQEHNYYFSLTASIGGVVFRFPKDLAPYHFNEANIIPVSMNDFGEFIGPSKSLTVNWSVISQNRKEPYSQYTDTFSLENLPITNEVSLSIDDIFSASNPKLDMVIEYKIDRMK